MMEIGNTPLVRLERLPGSGSAEVYVKWEGANPTASMKDRMALSMIEAAEARGDLRPGYSVVEYTGGSTGSSLAMVCAAKGYRARSWAAEPDTFWTDQFNNVDNRNGYHALAEEIRTVLGDTVSASFKASAPGAASLARLRFGSATIPRRVAWRSSLRTHEH